MLADTSPSIAATSYPSEQWVIAFQDEEGYLRTHLDDPVLTDLRLGMMVATSPSVTSDGDSYVIAFVIAFHADMGRNLWTYSAAEGTASNLGRGRRARARASRD